jgi:low affinity Fe/Cu permease
MSKERTLADGFQAFATKSSYWVGSRWAFAVALATIIVWAVSGPHFHYSDTWQLVVNTATTIVTFLMVFLIQNTQNRDARAIHLKLDEIIRAIRPADNNMIDIEKLSDEELQVLAAQFEKVRARGEPPKGQSNWVSQTEGVIHNVIAARVLPDTSRSTVPMELFRVVFLRSRHRTGHTRRSCLVSFGSVHPLTFVLPAVRRRLCAQESVFRTPPQLDRPNPHASQRSPESLAPHS